MKTPAELAAILRERLIHSRPHYDINGRPLRTIVVTQEWLEDMADAANALDAANTKRPSIEDFVTARINLLNNRPVGINKF